MMKTSKKCPIKVGLKAIAPLLVLWLAACSPAPTKQVPSKATPAPEITLEVPTDPQHQAYLGLSSENTFGLDDIQADLLIIEIFSMYCPHCQREAPQVNAVYHKIENDPRLRDRIKMIGIGVGDSRFEVELFQKRYKVPFPLFADTDLTVHRQFSEFPTPAFVCITYMRNHHPQIFYEKVGGFEDPGQFLKTVVQLSDMPFE